MFQKLRNVIQNHGRQLQTNFNRQFKNSGQLSTNNSSIVAVNEIFVFTLDQRFIPYDDVTLINESFNNCIVTVNNSHPSFLGEGNSLFINNQNVTDIRIKNVGSTSIAINELLLLYRHTGNEGAMKVQKASSAVGALSSIKILRGFG